MLQIKECEVAIAKSKALAIQPSLPCQSDHLFASVATYFDGRRPIMKNSESELGQAFRKPRLTFAC